MPSPQVGPTGPSPDRGGGEGRVETAGTVTVGAGWEKVRATLAPQDPKPAGEKTMHPGPLAEGKPRRADTFGSLQELSHHEPALQLPPVPDGVLGAVPVREVVVGALNAVVVVAGGIPVEGPGEVYVPVEVPPVQLRSHVCAAAGPAMRPETSATRTTILLMDHLSLELRESSGRMSHVKGSIMHPPPRFLPG